MRLHDLTIGPVFRPQVASLDSRRRRRRALIGAACLGVVLLTPSPAPGAPEAEFPTWHSQSYRFEDGLRAGLISAITQDVDGFLWLGTDAGLIRFDGLEFRTWASRGEPKLPDDTISTLLASRDGSVWVGFRNGKVSRISHGWLKTYTPHDGLHGGYVNGLVEDEQGTIWASTTVGLASLRDERWELREAAPGMPFAPIRTLRRSSNGALLVASEMGLYRRAPDQQQFEPIAPVEFRDVSEDRQGRVWVTDAQHGAVRLDAAGHAVNDHGSRSLRAAGSKLFHDSRGDLWIGTLGQGLWRSHETSTGLRVERASAGDGLDNDVVLSVFEDREGQVWVGGSTLTRYFRRDVTMITRAQGLANNGVRAVSAAGDGSIWTAAPDGLNRFPSASRLDERPQHVSTRSQPVALAAGADGGVWVGLRDGFGMATDRGFKEVALAAGTRFGAVMSMSSDRRGGVWLCHSADRRPAKWDGRTLVSFAEQPEIARRVCTTLYHDRGGRTWIGFADGTVAVNEGERFHLYDEKDGLSGAAISAIHEDAAAVVWIATGRGLSRFRDGAFVTLTERNGLPSQNFNALVEDRDGHLWLTYATGIVRLDKAEFDKAVTNPAYRVEYRLLDSSDGLRGSPTRVASPSSARRADGTLWFTTAGGVAVVDPARLGTNASEVIPRIDRILVDQKTIAWPWSAARLASGTSMLQIDYTAGSLAAASKIRFRYQLHGLDDEWVHAGGRRQAFYTNLPPGQYRFRLAASTNGGQESLIEWPFAVEPAFYQTRLFFAGATLVTLAALAAGWWLRMRGVNRRFNLVLAERARVGREIHDTVLQSLAATALQLEGIAKKIDVEPAIAKTNLRHVRRQVEQYLYEARQSIMELRSPALEKRPLLSALSESGEHLIGDEACHLHVVASGTPRRFPSDVDLQLLRIGQEAIRNAVRHGRAANICVDLVYDPAFFRLRVSDDGRGFTVVEDMFLGNQSWGLLGMRERAKRLGGTFTLTTSPGRGTVIETTISAPAAAE